VEDPTRVFRAVRFEQRFGFKIGKLTSNLIENAVRMDFFKELSGRRVFSELCQIFEEDKPVMAIRRLNEYKLLKLVDPRIIYGATLEELLTSVEKVLTWHNLLFLEDSCRKWAVYLLALVKPLKQEVVEELCERLELTERHQKIIVNGKMKADACLKWMERQKAYKNSLLYRKLYQFRTEILLYMMASTARERVRRAISRYFTTLRPTTTFLKGNDLKKMGFEPGPIYREILDSLLDARLNGKLRTREDEVGFVNRQWNTGDALSRALP
jgi:tRNA nucleotidyltransferase (CCA-adding enzyme)